eukprot:CAMPEP_0116007142 /NCGR_PEP_ID=MMETSP0321-20121206/2126_1 /TAXON_ID=163516 /ORGANISM="Leptocylindrus danicus var. danicus, Strain B650" /LENGTH=793 /DNA_ID=CAMNT_0003475787 /DNA_START=88 /DNA_END=2469 /DNA_ORIENTATION=+
MDFIVNVIKEEDSKEFSALTSIAYSPSEKHIVYAVRDDQTLLMYDAKSAEKLPAEINVGVHISSFSWFPAGNHVANIFACVCSDGTLRFLKSNGTLEKKVKAHRGAGICIKWNYDGSSLVTSGEDGEVKIWSRNGNLRAKLAEFSEAVYALCWGEKDMNESIVIAHGNKLCIVGTQSKGGTTEWEGLPKDRGIILAVDWNRLNGLIVVGGEDCIFRIFDSTGMLLHTSSALGNALTSLSWRPCGTSFLVGSYDTICLCDSSGLVQCQKCVRVGSIMDIAWNADGMQIACASAGGSIVLSNLVGQRYHGGDFIVTVVDHSLINVCNCETQDNKDSIRELEFHRGTIDCLAMSLNRLVVCTSSQCYIYNLRTLAPPATFDLRCNVSLVIASPQYFAICSLTAGVKIYSMEGRHVSSLRFPLRSDLLTKDNLSLSSVTVALIDQTNKKVIHLFDTLTGKQVDGKMGEIKHDTEIRILALSQWRGLNQEDRQLVFLDCKKELYIFPVIAGSGAQGSRMMLLQKIKIGTQIETFAWYMDEKADILATISGSRYTVWYNPGVIYYDKELSFLAKESRDLPEGSKNSSILTFRGSTMDIKTIDGVVMKVATSTYPTILYELVSSSRWEKAVHLCRLIECPRLWAACAGLALQYEELETLETALCALMEVEKVQYIKKVRDIKCIERRNVELMLYKKCDPEQAISILLQAKPPLIYRAIKVNIRLHRWEKALELAVKSAKSAKESFICVVLWYRQKFLDAQMKTIAEDDSRNFRTYFEKFPSIDEQHVRLLRENARVQENR